jgi:hypothetical protein
VGFELIKRCTFVVAVMLLLACAPQVVADETPHAGHAGHDTASAKTATGAIGLDVYADGGRVHLLVTERAAENPQPQMRYLRSDDGGASWSAPVTVGGGQSAPMPTKRGLEPQIAAAGDRLVAVWTTGAPTRFGRGPLASAVSSDGGRTWTPGPNPSDDKLATDHAFADLAADDAGNFHCVWLDGRHGARPDGTIAEDAGKGLRYARSTDGGRHWLPNVTLDAQCCECCWNSLLTLPGSGVRVLYRDRDPRDMALISSSDRGQTWGRPAAVGAFKWDFTGCPHVGGAVAATDPTGKHLAAVVWTAKGGDDVGAFAVSSSDAGHTWTTPARLGGPQSSRPDIASDGRHVVVATWDEYLEAGDAGGNAAFYAMSSDAGKSWSPPVRLSPAGASATYPRVVRTPAGFRVFWTQKVPGKPWTWTSREVK